MSSAGDDPLNSVGEIYFVLRWGDLFYTPLGINFQSLLGMILQLHWGSFFRLRWENFDSTGDILYSVGEYSYTPLENIKTSGDIKPSQC